MHDADTVRLLNFGSTTRDGFRQMDRAFVVAVDVQELTGGGLWLSADEGACWTRLASHLWQDVGQGWGDRTCDEDAAGDPRSGGCGQNEPAGGRLLAAHSGEHPSSGDVIYIANADDDTTQVDHDGDEDTPPVVVVVNGNRGAALWDGAESCAPPNTGDPLPHGWVGALLRLDAQPNGTEVLVVGYRPMCPAASTLHARGLPPGGSTCSGSASAVCGVYGAPATGVSNLTGVAPAPWSDTVMVTGKYIGTYGGVGTTVVRKVYGGACLVDLVTGVATAVTDPRSDARAFSLASANPHVADMWVLLPELQGSYQQCVTAREGTDGSSSGWKTDCPNVTPLLVTGGPGATSTREVPAPMPNGYASGAWWSDLDTPDDSANGAGTWLAVSTFGSGTWRAELTW